LLLLTLDIDGLTLLRVVALLGTGLATVGLLGRGWVVPSLLLLRVAALLTLRRVVAPAGLAVRVGLVLAVAA